MVDSTLYYSIVLEMKLLKSEVPGKMRLLKRAEQTFIE